MERKTEIVYDAEIVEALDDKLDAKEILRGLRQLGISPEFLAAAANVPVSKVEQITTIKVSHLAPADEDLAEKVRKLAELSIKEAFLIMEYGPTEQKMRVMSMVLGNASRLIGQPRGSSTEEVRQELDGVYAAMRQTGTANATTRSAIGPANDQDETSGTEAAGSSG